jgi:hypothetical protein
MVSAGPIRRNAALEAARNLTIGESLEGLGRYQEAKGWYRSSLNVNTRDVAVADVADRVAWCDWCSHNLLR